MEEPATVVTIPSGRLLPSPPTILSSHLPLQPPKRGTQHLSEHRMSATEMQLQPRARPQPSFLASQPPQSPLRDILEPLWHRKKSLPAHENNPTLKHKGNSQEQIISQCCLEI